MNKILLNNEAYMAKEQDLPCLVIYGDKSGGSHFTVTLVADLFSSGSKLLFFTAFPMAKDNFLEQTVPHHSKISFVNSVDELKNNSESDVIILESGNESLFIEAVKILEDINERVVLIKNIEAFTQDVFTASLALNKCVLSGNIDMCAAKYQILGKDFKTIIVFTKPEISLPIEVPALEKWTGYLSSETTTGIIKVEIN